MIGSVNTGGGVSKAFAYIAVTYPAGSKCTCSSGTKILKSKDTTGYVTFAVPYPGLWAVYISDESHSPEIKSVTIEEQDEGLIVPIKIAYTLWIYDQGTEYFPLSFSDWSNGTGAGSFRGTFTRNAIDFYLKCTEVSGGNDAWFGRSTSSAVDATSYTKMVLVLNSWRCSGAPGDWQSYGANTERRAIKNLPYGGHVLTNGSGTNTTLELDITGANLIYPCIIMRQYASAGVNEVYVRKWYLTV